MINEIEFAQKYLNEYKTITNNNGTEIVAEVCPFCNGGRHRDKHTFSINQDKHTFNCLRGSCGARGTFKELCEQYNEGAEYMKQFRQKNFDRIAIKKQYTKPKLKVDDLSNVALEYLKLRGFSERTIKRFEIKSDKNNNIVFQYKNENKEVVLNKMRIPRAFKKGVDKTKIWQEGGGQPILYGMDKVDTKLPIVITEGEMDCLAVYESGYDNVVSIPFGTNNMDWVNECWEFLNKCTEVILWFDSDTAGQKAVSEVARKIGLHKCRIVNSEYKDGNVCLYKDGKQKVIELIESSDFIPIDNLSRLSDCKGKQIDRILFGNQFLDFFLGGCRMGELSVWTGKRGSGKSTILNQTLVDSVDQECKCFLYTGELNNSKAKQWIDRQIAGERYIVTYIDDLTHREEYGVHPDILPIIEDWYKDYIFAYGDEGEDDIESLIEVMEYAYKRYNCKRFIIDNLKTLRVTESRDFYRQQALIINMFRKFAVTYNVHIDLVVHPRKTMSDKLSDEDVGGTSDIIDLAHNIIEIQRIYKDKLTNEDEQKYFENDTILRIKKNREYGDVGNESFYKFNQKSKRIYGKSGCKTYSWEKDVKDRNIVLDDKNINMQIENNINEVSCPWD